MGLGSRIENGRCEDPRRRDGGDPGDALGFFGVATGSLRHGSGALLVRLPTLCRSCWEETADGGGEEEKGDPEGCWEEGSEGYASGGVGR